MKWAFALWHIDKIVILRLLPGARVSKMVESTTNNGREKILLDSKTVVKFKILDPDNFSQV